MSLEKQVQSHCSEYLSLTSKDTEEDVFSKLQKNALVERRRLLDKLSSSDPTIPKRRPVSHKDNDKSCKGYRETNRTQIVNEILRIPTRDKARSYKHSKDPFEYAIYLIYNHTSIDEGKQLTFSSPNTLKDSEEAFHFVKQQDSPPCRFSNLYWLEFASSSIVKQDSFCTISRLGITRFKGSEVDFTDLRTWIFEKSVFDRIVQMKCVQNVRMVNLFFTWKEKVFSFNNCRSRYLLSRLLFTCNSRVSKYLSVIKTECTVLSNICLFQQPQKQSHSISNFKELQSRYVASHMHVMRICCSRIIHLVKTMLESVIEEYAILDKNVLYSAEGDSKIRELRRMPPLCRLCDFMVVESLVDCMLNSLNALENSIGSTHLQENEDYVAPLTIDLKFVKSSNKIYITTVTPIDEWLKVIQYMVLTYGKELDSLPRIVSTKSISDLLSTFSDPSRKSDFDGIPYKLSQLVSLLPMYTRFANHIHKRLNIVFHTIDQQIQSVLQPLEDIQNQGQSDISNPKDYYTTVDLFELQTNISKWIEFKNMLSRFSPFDRIGCFILNRSFLLESCASIVDQKLDMIHESLPVLLSNYIEEAISEVERTTCNLAAFPEKIELAETWMNAIDSVSLSGGTRKIIQDKSDCVNSLMEIMDSIGLKCNEARRRSSINEKLEFYARVQQWKSRIQVMNEAYDRAMTHKKEHNDWYLKEIYCNYEAIDSQAMKLYEEINASCIWDMSSDWKQSKLMVTDHLNTVKSLKDHTQKWENLEILMKNHSTFKNTQVHQALNTMIENLHILFRMRESINSWVEFKTQWYHMPISQINICALKVCLINLERPLNSVYRQQRILNNQNKLLLCTLEEYTVTVRRDAYLLEALLNSKLLSRHWKIMFEILIPKTTQNESRSYDAISFSTILQYLVEEGGHEASKIHQLKAISDRATEESKLRNTIDHIQNQLRNSIISVTKYRYSYILGGMLSYLEKLEDWKMSIEAILHKDNPWLNETEDMHSRITTTQSLLMEWNTLQRYWMHLSKLVFLPNIRNVKSELWKQFDTLDSVWRKQMRYLKTKPCSFTEFSSCAFIKGPEVDLYMRTCENIMKELRSDLLNIRQRFARFFFLADEEVIDLLGHNNKPGTIQRVACKCFPNARNLTFQIADSSHDKVEECETIEFVTSIVCIGNVSLAFQHWVKKIGSVIYWISQVELEMYDTLKQEISRAIATLDAKYDAITNSNSKTIDHRMDWIEAHVPQAIFISLHVVHCSQIVYAFCDEDATDVCKFDRLNIVLKSCEEDYLYFVQRYRFLDKSLSQFKVENVLVLYIYQIQVIKTLLKCFHTSISKAKFFWERQIRYLSDENNDYSIKYGHLNFILGYEFSGCEPLPIITPDTERCYFAIASAIHIHHTAMVYGKVGSGKSTILRTLSNSMLRFYWALSCTQHTNPSNISNFIYGICQIGGWGCIDNIINANMSVMVTILDHIRCVDLTKFSSKSEYVFQGQRHSIHTKKTHGLFLSVGVKNLFSAPLPPSFRSLFRPVHISLPHFESFVNVLLRIHGFNDSQVNMKQTR